MQHEQQQQDLTVTRVAITCLGRGSRFTLTCPADQKEARLESLRLEGCRVVDVRTAPAGGWQPK